MYFGIILSLQPYFACRRGTYRQEYAAIAQALVCQVVENLVKAGMDVPVFKSSNIDGGDEHNHRMFEKYYGYWK